MFKDPRANALVNDVLKDIWSAIAIGAFVLGTAVWLPEARAFALSF